MGETKVLHYYDFRISGRVPEPQSQLFLSLETPGYLKQIKKISWAFKTYYFYQSQNVGTPFVSILEKTGTEQNDDPSNQIKSGKSCIWDEYLPENMKWTFGNLLEPRNHTTIKP